MSKKSVGPRTEDERGVFACEELRADVQLEIERALRAGEVSRAELARRLGCSQARVSQLLGDNANLTLETIARVFLALDRTCSFSSSKVGRADVGSPARPLGMGWQQSKPSRGTVPRDAPRSAVTKSIVEALKRDTYVFASNDNVSSELTPIFAQR